jgi:hypothetical protein
MLGIMGIPTIQVIVDEPLKRRLEDLARADGRSVSSYVRVLINRHLVALDQARFSHAHLAGVYE